MVRYSVLASGSSGNAILVQTDEVTILIDAGLSGRQIEAAMKEVGVSADSLSGIFVTHEHIDHVKGVGILSRRYKIPIFANQGTWDGMQKSIGEIKAGFYEQFNTSDHIEIGNLALQSFPISHDSKEPVGYCIYCGNTKLSIGTDMGYVNQKMKELLIGSDALIIEANHDVAMLRVGPYPWHLKQRILSDYGHLSNEAAGELLTEIISANTQCVHLAHLSKENNMPQLAHLTVKSILEEEQFKVGQEFDLEITYPNKPTKLREVKRR